MTRKQHLDTLLSAAKAGPVPRPSTELIARVLADAAENVPVATAVNRAAPDKGLLARFLSPIGGFGGAFALAACAAFGVVAGAGYADILFEIPGLDSVLTTLTVDPDSTSPYESLSLLMSES